MNNPELINRKRRPPNHAETENDLDNMKAHLATLDTEGSFPAHTDDLRNTFSSLG